MELGIVGLGRMGANIARRLMRDGHRVVVHDINPEATAALAGEGADGAGSPAELAEKLSPPRAVWVMVPAGDITEQTVAEVAAELEPGTRSSTVATPTTATTSAAPAELGDRGIDYIDCGTSGGVFGLDRGYCLMVGGPDEAFARLEPIFATLAPGVEAAERTPGREGEPLAGRAGVPPLWAGRGRALREDGPQRHRVRPHGRLRRGPQHPPQRRRGRARGVRRRRDGAARRPEYYRYEIDTAEVAEVWRRGSVVGSWLLDLTAAALAESPRLEEFEGRVSDSGEGRWTSVAAIEEGVPAPVLTAALYSRFASRDLDDFANRVLSAMRKQFGGHEEKKD